MLSFLLCLRDEINENLDRFDPLHLFSFSFLLPPVPRETLVTRGYPVHSNVDPSAES